jgi:hypothetical protein
VWRAEEDDALRIVQKVAVERRSTFGIIQSLEAD